MLILKIAKNNRYNYISFCLGLGVGFELGGHERNGNFLTVWIEQQRILIFISKNHVTFK